MDSDKKIIVIDFEQDMKRAETFSLFEGYYERRRGAMYFLNCQARILRRKELIKYLIPMKIRGNLKYME